jgi:hypothetical protein
MKKETRGRKALPQSEKKKPITILVKYKNHKKAAKEALALAVKYNSENATTLQK